MADAGRQPDIKGCSANREGMETLVRLDDAEDVDGFLEAVSWHHCAIELDLTGLDEAAYRTVAAALDDHPAPVKSVHYGRTATVSLQEWELFRSQLDTVTERAERFDCGVVSVAPPRAEINESHTVRDLQEFMVEANAYAVEADLDLCFLLDGFMKDPEMMNTAFGDLESPSLGVMVDLSRIVDGVNPLPILEKIDVAIRKVRLPVPLDEVDQHIGELSGDMLVVAERF